MAIDPEHLLLQPCQFIIGRTMANPRGYTCNTSSVERLTGASGIDYYACEEHRIDALFKAEGR